MFCLSKQGGGRGLRDAIVFVGAATFLVMNDMHCSHAVQLIGTRSIFLIQLVKYGKQRMFLGCLRNSKKQISWSKDVMFLFDNASTYRFL